MKMQNRIVLPMRIWNGQSRLFQMTIYSTEQVRLTKLNLKLTYSLKSVLSLKQNN
jgi:hypothetical protein